MHALDPKLGARFDGVKIYCAKDVLENAADGDFRWVSKLGNRGVVSISYAFCSSDDDNGDNSKGVESSSRQLKDTAEGAVECRSRDEIWRVKMLLEKKVGKIGVLNMSIFVNFLRWLA